MLALKHLPHICVRLQTIHSELNHLKKIISSKEENKTVLVILAFEKLSCHFLLICLNLCKAPMESPLEIFKLVCRNIIHVKVTEGSWCSW